MILDIFKKMKDYSLAMWEIIDFIDNKGFVICKSGKIIKLMRPLNIIEGQYILVYKGKILKIEKKNKRIFGTVGVEKEMLIMCSVGINTVDYNKIYFVLDPSSNSLTEINPNWNFIDDGMYVPEIDPGSPVFYDDPYAYDYKYKGNGLNIPESPSGIASKFQSGKSVRFILNNSLEDEPFAVWLLSLTIESETVESNFLSYESSLCTKPYKITGRPFMNRYTPNGIVSIHKILSGVNNNVLQIKYYDTNEGTFAGFGDRYAIVENVFKKTFTGITTSKSIEGDSGALVGATGFGDISESQKVLRPYTFELTGRKYGEPIINEEYNASDQIYEGETERYERCSESGCYTSGYPPFLANDIKLPYTLDNTGRLTYIRMLKDTNFSQLTTELYFNNILIDSSGQESVDHIQNYEGTDDDVINFAFQREYYAVKTRYTIHQVYNDSIFSLIFYSKTIQQNKTENISDEYGIRDDNDESGVVYRYINQIEIESQTTWHVYVNGKSYQLDFNRNIIEYFMMLAAGSENRVPVENRSALKRADNFLQVFSWFDIKDGNEPHITRIFTSATKQYIMLGFDVFDFNLSHELIHYPDEKALMAVYDRDNLSSPVILWTDNQVAPGNRVWLLYDTSGVLLQTYNPTQYNRVNGLALLDSSDTY